MIGRLLSLLVVFLIGWVVYVTAFGDEDDIERRNKLFQSVGELTGNVTDILSSEKDKIEAGVYDEQLDMLKKAIDNLKEAGGEAGEYADQIKSLQEQQQQLQEQANQLKQQTEGGEPTAQPLSRRSAEDPMRDGLKSLVESVQSLKNKMEKDNQKAE